MSGASYIFRGGAAIGDALFCSAMPRLLRDEGYDEVVVGCKPVTAPIWENNPHVARVELFPERDQDDEAWYQKWVEDEKAKYSRIINTSGHIEVSFLSRTDLDYGLWPKLEEARDRAAGVSYQDYLYGRCGFDAVGVLPEIYFSTEEQEIVEQNKRLKDGRKLILWQTQGSTRSKQLVKMPEWLTWAMQEFPDAVHYVWCADPDLSARLPKGPVKNMWGATSVRESLRLVASADLVVGPESFLVNAAPAFGVPTIIFFSHSLPDNLSRYYCDSVAITPNCECHPCYLIGINFRRVHNIWQRRVARECERGCQTPDPNYEYRKLGYRCCLEIDDEQVYQALAKIIGNGLTGGNK